MSLDTVGRSLLERSDALARLALGGSDDPIVAAMSSHISDQALVLCERLALSLAFSRPVGLVSWGDRVRTDLGRVEALDLISAVVDTMLNAPELDGSEIVAAYLENLRTVAIDAVLGCKQPSALSDADDSAEVMLTALAARCSESAEHSRATAAWTRRLSVALELDPATARFAERSALLHDIGKIGIPDAILLKPTALLSHEWDCIREHSALGQRMLDGIPSLRRYALVVRAHHERWDGMGYPDGLKGNSIPREARIVAVADAFHAMLSERPFRAAIPPRTALAILRDGSGAQWDPQIVDAFMTLFEDATSKTAAHPVPSHQVVSMA